MNQDASGEADLPTAIATSVAASLRRKARRCRYTSWAIFSVIIVVIGLYGLLFVNTRPNANSGFLPATAVECSSKDGCSEAPAPQMMFMEPSDAKLIRLMADTIATERISEDNKKAIIGDLAGTVSEIEKSRSNMQPIGVSNLYLQTGIVSILSNIGIIAFIIVIINIGVNFFRFYARLSEIYDSQADALDLSGGDINKYASILDVISPGGVDFGKLPKPLYDQIVSALAEIRSRKSDPSADN